MYQQYRWDPQEYRNSSSNQRTWAVELLTQIRLSGTETVLDVGCGDGEITALIAARVPQGFARGIDSSKEMVELARRTYPPRRYRNLRFAVKDARRLTMVEEFDLVFSNSSLHWVVDHRPVLEGIRRSLKPSGRLLAQMGGSGNAAKVVSAVEAVAGNEGGISIGWKADAADHIGPGRPTLPGGPEPQHRSSRWVEITVRDTGCGMDPGVAQRVFDPFFSYRTAGRGRGLGLARAQRIVEAHGGRIWAVSQPGEGTEFHLVLPQAGGE